LPRRSASKQIATRYLCFGFDCYADESSALEERTPRQRKKRGKYIDCLLGIGKRLWLDLVDGFRHVAVVSIFIRRSLSS
jgi:hypothetical protein